MFVVHSENKEMCEAHMVWGPFCVLAWHLQSHVPSLKIGKMPNDFLFAIQRWMVWFICSTRSAQPHFWTCQTITLPTFVPSLKHLCIKLSILGAIFNHFVWEPQHIAFFCIFLNEPCCWLWWNIVQTRTASDSQCFRPSKHQNTFSHGPIHKREIPGWIRYQYQSLRSECSIHSFLQHKSGFGH